MENRLLIESLKNDAIIKGLCVPWQRKFDRSGINTKQMARMFVKGIDFCISENYPTLEFLRQNFMGLLIEHNIFIDDKDIVRVNVPDVVLNGDCIANLFYSGYTVSRLYIRHDSKATILTDGHSILTIDAFDNATVNIDILESSKVIINLYGNAKAVPNVGTYAKAIVRNKNKATY